MFQKFITCLFDNSYISYMGLCMRFMYMLYVYALFFLRLTIFFIVRSIVSCHSYAKIWFQKQYHSY